jgi:Flp pilus assembly pilin Flp
MSTHHEPLPPLGVTTLAARENGNAYSTARADPSWELAKIEDIRLNWDKVFPYQLMILWRNGGKWEPAPSYVQGVAFFDTTTFTLPIPPQTLSIDMPFAATVEATQGGIIEQFNGAPFRDIQLQGTTGVLPLRGTTETPTTKGPFPSILVGTANAVQNIKTAIQAPQSVQPNVIAEEDFANVTPESPAQGTGYAQFLLLKRFLERYAQIKKRKEAQNITLGFAIHKEKEVYLVTPLKFSLQRTGAKGLHYNYSLALRAWKRVVPSVGAIGTPTDHTPRDPSAYASVLNAIDKARRTLENVSKVISAARADADAVVLDNLRQVSLFLKSGVGVGTSLMDFGNGLVADAKGPLMERLTAIARITEPSTEEIIKALSISPDTVARDAQLRAAIEMLVDAASVSEKRATQAAQITNRDSKLRETQTVLKDRASAADKLFANPRDYYGFWEKIRTDSLNFRPETLATMRDIQDAVADLRRDDFARMRDEISSVLDDFSIAVGAGDSTYSAVFGVPDRPPLRTAPTEQDWEVMGALNDAIVALEQLTASKAVNQNDTNAIDYVAGLATRAGLAFTTPQSKFLVPFPYGYTLEQVAEQYLGDPDRWIELAALNGLKAPYVDEVGRTDFLVSNGIGNQVAVASADGYYVQQPVWISALGVIREKRRITKIDTISADVTLLSLDGEGDLDRFTLSNQASVQSFAPETTNSLQFIYIPSTETTESDWLTVDIPGVDTFDPLFRVGGADLLLDETGDLVIAPDGTTRLAVGLTNLIQRVRIAVATPQGSLMNHPEFGFGVVAGTSSADLNAKQVLAAARQFIKNEEGFTGVEYASVVQVGNAINLTMSVGIAGVNKNVPITVRLK